MGDSAALVVLTEEAPGEGSVHPNLRPPWKPGQSGNPAGKLSKRALVAKEYAKAIGLEYLAELAFNVKARRGELIESLLDLAIDGEGEHGTGKAAAHRLLLDVLSLGEKQEAKATLEVQVVRRKVRVMDVEELSTADAQDEIEARGEDAALSPLPQDSPDPDQEESGTCTVSGSYAPDSHPAANAAGGQEGSGAPPSPDGSRLPDRHPGAQAPGGKGDAPAAVRPIGTIDPSGLTPLARASDTGDEGADPRANGTDSHNGDMRVRPPKC